MGQITREIKSAMGKLWRNGSTMDNIVDWLADEHAIFVTRQTVQYHATQNRNMFPPRDREFINSKISDAAQKNLKAGKNKAPTPKRVKKKEVDPDYEGW